MTYSKFNQQIVNSFEKLNPKQALNFAEQTEFAAISAQVAKNFQQQMIQRDPLSLGYAEPPSDEVFKLCVCTALNAITLAKRKNLTAVLLLPEGQTTVSGVLQKFDLYKFLGD